MDIGSSGTRASLAAQNRKIIIPRNFMTLGGHKKAAQAGEYWAETFI